MYTKSIKKNRSKFIKPKDKKNDIPSINSKSQIKYLWNDQNLRTRLCDTVNWTRFANCPNLSRYFVDKIDAFVRQNLPDDIIYKKMRNFYLNKIINDDEFSKCTSFLTRDVNRAKEVVKLSNSELKHIPRKKLMYLDIGSGDCSITSRICEQLEIPYENTYATDILLYKPKNDKINFIKVDDESFPEEWTGKFHLVTCLMSLHHMQNDIKMINNIFRILNDDGILVIREHDCLFNKLRVYLDVLHGFHLSVFSDEMEDFSEKYHANYHSFDFWNTVLELNGFKLLKSVKRRGNPGEKYHACYAKNIEKKNSKISGGKTIFGIEVDTTQNSKMSLDVEVPKQALIKGPGDYPKDQVAEKLIPEEITECSLTVSGKTCTDENVVRAIGKIMGIDIHTNPKQIMELAKNKTSCSTERCVLNRPAVSRALGEEIIKKELLRNFKIPGPTDVSLLNNVNIDNTLIQWGHKFHDFYPCDFNMADYENTMGTLLTTDMKEDVYDKGFRTFGCVINSDVSTGRGKHWMALFADMRDTSEWSAEFYNSSGNPPVEAWSNWLRRTITKFKEISKAYSLNVKKFSIVKVSKLKHQESQTECGVYALYYIWARLNGVPYKYFENHNVPDKWMFEMRQHLFYDKRRPMMKKFSYNDFAKTTRVKWEI